MGSAEMVKQEQLLMEKEGSLVWLVINRPEVHNCLNRSVLNALLDSCAEIALDPEVRVVSIIGAGSKVFCAGADLQERKGMTEGETLDYIALIQRAMRAVETLPQPVIAAVNGSAFGGGTELALACDLRVMLSDATLRLTEVKLGIIPGAGGTQRLPRLIGKSKAKEMILTAAPIGAAEGRALGLIHRVVERSENDSSAEEAIGRLRETVRLWAEEIAQSAPLSLKQAKFAIDQGYDRDLESGLAIETKAYIQLLNTKDRLEGLAAFAEKRKPEYRGE